MTRSLPRFYYFANSVLRLLFPLCRVRVTVRGVEHVPPEGSFILVSNHLSLLDPPLLGTYIPRSLVMMAKAETFEGNGLLRWIVSHYGAFPVRRGEADIGAIRRAMKVLKEGQVLYIAPEGTRSRTGQIGDPHEGAALLALRSGVPVLPVGISGIEKFARRIRRWQETPVELSIGSPFYLVGGQARGERPSLEAFSAAIMERVARELPPFYRGRFGQPHHQHLVQDVVKLAQQCEHDIIL